ncbi:hypothetical protein [Streptosporangium sp. KLBMP 9127]|nr:hypothetical protein [Streptosporangium sp. KLBMP 9127]
MMRAAAKAMLYLYPQAWRDRYGEEVTDLVTSRPARLRTVLDLLAGAADAWLHHRRNPAAKPVRIPLAVVLSITGTALLLLWNPGVRDVASLNGAWGEAAGIGSLAGQLRGIAMSLFVISGVSGILSVVPLLLASHATMKGSSHGQLTRMTARHVVVTALLLAVPIALFGYSFYGMAFTQLGFPVGPLGEAMTGGFIVPIILALLLPLPTIAAAAPSLLPDVRKSGGTLAVAAIFNALAWLPVMVLLALGLQKTSWTFVAAVTAGALVSVWMSALVARNVLRQGRTAMGWLSPG